MLIITYIIYAYHYAHFFITFLFQAASFNVHLLQPEFVAVSILILHSSGIVWCIFIQHLNLSVVSLHLRNIRRFRLMLFALVVFLTSFLLSIQHSLQLLFHEHPHSSNFVLSFELCAPLAFTLLLFVCITNIQLVVVHNISSSSNILINFYLSNKNVSYIKLHLLVALVKMALSSSYDLRRIDRYYASNIMFLIMHMSLLVFFSCCLLPQILSSALHLMCVQLVVLLISS